MEATITIPFGAAGYRAMVESIKKHFDIKTGFSEAQGRMLEAIVAEMKAQGYSRDTIGRAVFEDALDYAVKIKIAAVVRFQNQHKKVPKTLKFEVSVPRRE